MKYKSLFIPFIFLFSWINKSNSEALKLNSEEIDKIILDNEFVLINFYADWCPFSQMLSPVWDVTALMIGQGIKNISVVVGKVDCVTEKDLAAKFEITKFPTIKYVRNGQIGKSEYRGERSPEGFLEFVQKKTKNSLLEFSDWSAIHNLDDERKHIVGFLQNKQENTYKSFIEAAADFHEECTFHFSLGHQDDRVIFDANTLQEAFEGNMSYFSAFSNWVQDKCTPLVREITFQNAEELTEEGKPFVILFHHPDEKDSLKQYSEVIAKELMEEMHNVNFLHADGLIFAHPLLHLDKTAADLPVIAIDSFQHIYLFSNFQDIHSPGKLKAFIEDLNSGKLHRKFHEGPDPKENVEADKENTKKESDKKHDVQGDSSTTPAREEIAKEKSSSPPPSIFKHLGPSPKRYTFKDEF